MHYEKQAEIVKEAAKRFFLKKIASAMASSIIYAYLRQKKGA